MVCSWCCFKHSTSWSSSSKVDSDVRVVYSSFFSHGFQGLKSMYRRLLPGGKTWHGDYWTVYNLSVIKISRKVGLSSQPSKTRGKYELPVARRGKGQWTNPNWKETRVAGRKRGEVQWTNTCILLFVQNVRQHYRLDKLSLPMRWV